MFQHILLPTDGSKLSARSVKHGVGMAKALKANITALHVTPRFYPFVYEMDLPENVRDDFAKASEASARKHLDFVKRVATKAGVECEVVHATSDQPFKEIIKTAHKKKCDLILMVSHGRRGLAGFLLGSETQKVLTHSRIPVLVYR